MLRSSNGPPSPREFARAARKHPTAAEAALWQALRAHRCGGAHFRRQMPIGPYCADFACISARLIVEVDGRTHLDPETVARDARRDTWLRARGWRVLRFSDDVVLGGLTLVVARLENEIATIRRQGGV